MNKILLCCIALFFTACMSANMQAFVQTNNEGIFIKSEKNQSIAFHFKNPSNYNTTLEYRLKKKFQELGFRVVDDNADYNAYINLVDFRKFSFAQRMSSASADFFFSGFDTIYNNYEMYVENYFIMQVNIKIESKTQTQKTSLVARTAYLSNLKRCQDALENKIIEQISSFFYFN
ncbi:hypothetical protein [Campylobacter sp. US33a]|uniref:hypothetical protein n=1 Tax=Campylobacter sp. US33a TaxID=2498120 RepID=UPI0010679B92|nr:hypothetical protein [Campylobacter sp. US33a]TEY03188.1 hypothetical protein ELQ16_04435 [Campylobacter sp. US33a]